MGLIAIQLKAIAAVKEQEDPKKTVMHALRLNIATDANISFRKLSAVVKTR